MFRKRMIEEFNWKLEQAKSQIREELQNEYATKFRAECDTFTKATELQQGIYDKKIRQLEEVAKTAYAKGRNEVLDLVRAKIESGEIVRVRTNEPNEQPQVGVQTQE